MSATIPRLMASSAISRWVQWVIGRPLSCGGSQARAMIPHTCSGVKVGGVPGRGASDNRSATLAPEFSDHRRRHAWTVERPMPSSSAVGRTPAPRPANNMIRARTAICCGQVCCRTSASNCRRSRSVTGTGVARSNGIAEAGTVQLETVFYSVLLINGIRIYIKRY